MIQTAKLRAISKNLISYWQSDVFKNAIDIKLECNASYRTLSDVCQCLSKFVMSAKKLILNQR